MTMSLNKNNRGFTLIELLVVLTIVAMLALIAIPSMRPLIEGRRTSAYSRTLLADIAFARSEAVARSTNVTICASLNGSTCSGSNAWGNGWIVTVDNVNDCVDAGSCVLRVEGDSASTVNTSSTVNSLTYNPFGEVNASGSFVICGADVSDTSHARTITLRSSGSRTVKDSAASCTL